MPKVFKKRDKFAALPEGFKDAIDQSSTDDIRRRVAEIALLECNERQQLKADPDVEQAKDALKNLMEPYRENLKSFKIQIEYCNQVLGDKGGGAAKK